MQVMNFSAKLRKKMSKVYSILDVKLIVSPTFENNLWLLFGQLRVVDEVNLTNNIYILQKLELFPTLFPMRNIKKYIHENFSF